jgi:hypothetical protein
MDGASEVTVVCYADCRSVRVAFDCFAEETVGSDRTAKRCFERDLTPPTGSQREDESSWELTGGLQIQGSRSVLPIAYS